MSASRDKKQRQQTEGLTEKQRQQALEDQKAHNRQVVYTILGVIAALLVAALLIWNSGFFQKRAAAVTVGDETYTVSDFSYYYYLLVNSTASTARTYAQYGISTGYDPDQSPADQMYDDDTTYEEYFRQTAVDNLQRVALLCGEADTAGYTLSEDGQQSVDDVVGQIKTYSTQYGYSEEAYLQLLYGPYMTKDVFVRQLTKDTLASEYQTHYTDSLTYTNDQLEAYYDDNAATLDTYDYRYCFISGSAPSTTDADGNTVDPTDEEKAAAMDAAKAKADEMIARYEAGEAFNTIAMDYVDAPDSYSDAEYSHLTDKIGSDISSYAYGSWLMDDARQAGDIGAVESEGSGYYVVAMLGRHRAEDTYQTVDVRHILITAETDEATDDTQDVLPTEEQLAAAYTEAERILNEWKAGDANSDSFAALANEYSDDPGSNTNGGLYEGVTRGQMITSFNDWIFTPGRQPGDTGIVVNTDGSTDDVRGYHVMYFEAAGQVRWMAQAQSALSAADYQTWFESTQESYPVTERSGLTTVG